MSHYIPPVNTKILKKKHIDLFPKRRSSDRRRPFSSTYLTTFTDLIALLLVFFIMMYATREPAPLNFLVIDPPAIAAPVKPTPPNISVQPSLSETPAGLELNYLAALLNQAATRETALQKAQITTYPYALHVDLPVSALDTANAVLDRVSGSNRSVIITAPQVFLDALWGGFAQTDSDILFIPTRDNIVHILIH